jgi:hypothetical protein
MSTLRSGHWRESVSGLLPRSQSPRNLKLMNPSSALATAIDNLYRVFRGYRPKQMAGCSCCTSDKEAARLVASDLRSLKAEELCRYSTKAMTTWGTVDDFKHFLPRLMEIVAREPMQWQIEIVLSKPAYAQWTQWPTRERQSLQAFFDSLWTKLLSEYPLHDYNRIGDYLCGIGQSVEDLSGYLEQWARDESLPAALHLADFITENCPSNYKKPPHLANAFWEARSAQAQQVWKWLLDDGRSAKIETAFFRYGEQDRENKLSVADAELAILRGWAPAAASTSAAPPPRS